MADKSKLGMEFSPYTFEVEKGKIAEFAMAISQKEDKDQVNPLYVNREAAQKAGYKDIIAPPTFQTCFPLWAGGGLMPLIQVPGHQSYSGSSMAKRNTITWAPSIPATL